jgi:hypothetical protein
MANVCEDGFQELQALQQRKAELERQLQDSERARKAGERFTREEVGNKILLPRRNGTVRELDDKEISRGLGQFTDQMESRELEDFVDKSIDGRARPNGAEGQFLNFQQMLEEIGDVRELADVAKVARALGLTWKKIAPEDHAFVTGVYSKERMAKVLAEAMREFGLDEASLLAKMTNDTAAFAGLVERMARSKLFAEGTLTKFVDATDRILAEMERLPGGQVPDELKQEAYKWYKWSLLGQRNLAFNKRSTGQTLRSLQDNVSAGEWDMPDFTEAPWLSPEADRLTPGGAAGVPGGAAGVPGAPGSAADAADVPGADQNPLGLTPDDVGPDSVIGQIIQAVDDGPAAIKTLQDIVDTVRIEGVDRKAKINEGWFNVAMRRSMATVKDSQLSSLNTAVKSGVLSSVDMMFYGPLKTTFKNGMTMVPAGTGSLKKLGLIESAQISAKSYRYALSMTRTGLKKMLKEAYFDGKTRFGGNPDTYGRLMSDNATVRAEIKADARQAWSQKNFVANLALLGPKVNARVRLKLQELHHDIPLRPALRFQGAVDEFFGKPQYLFHLMADLEVKARAEAVTLGLDTEAKRNDWVQDQIQQAVYQVIPTEANVKAYRKQMKLGAMDDQLAIDGLDVPGMRLTDQQVMDRMIKDNMAGSPTFGTPASLRAFQYAAEMRMQQTPGVELGKFAGNTDDWIKDVDIAVRMLRHKNYFFDKMLPYWRSPVNATLFTLRGATSPFYDPLKMATLAIKGKAGEEEMAEVASRWAISMGLLGVFAAADQAGVITGNSHPDPSKRNSFMGVPFLGGLPILSVLFLWKDVKDAMTKAGASDLDGNEMHNGVLQVLTGTIMRGTGIAQLQQLVHAFGDGNMDAWDALVAFGGFQLKGHFIPFTGAVGSFERLGGFDLANQYRDGKNTPQLDFEAGQIADADDWMAPIVTRLRNLAYAGVPGLAGAQGHRKDKDWLGYDRGHINGLNFDRAGIPIGTPGAWPPDPIYSELETMGQLDTPIQLRRRNLDGVGMSAALQREFVEIYGTVKGDSLLAMNEMAGRKVTAKFPIGFSTVLPNGVRIVGGKTENIDLAYILEKHVKGRKIADALRSLFKDPVYQAMEADPALTSDLSRRDMPQAMRRQQPAQELINGIKTYYLDLTRAALERRGASGESAEAKAWSDSKTRAIMGRTQDALGRLQPLINALGGGQ